MAEERMTADETLAARAAGTTRIPFNMDAWAKAFLETARELNRATVGDVAGFMEDYRGGYRHTEIKKAAERVAGVFAVFVEEK